MSGNHCRPCPENSPPKKKDLDYRIDHPWISLFINFPNLYLYYCALTKTPFKRPLDPSPKRHFFFFPQLFFLINNRIFVFFKTARSHSNETGFFFFFACTPYNQTKGSILKSQRVFFLLHHVPSKFASHLDSRPLCQFFQFGAGKHPLQA